jgi:hypothetical protein
VFNQSGLRGRPVSLCPVTATRSFLAASIRVPPTPEQVFCYGGVTS